MTQNITAHYSSRLVNKLLNVQRNSKFVLVSVKDIAKRQENTHYSPLFHGNESVTDFKRKAKVFTLFSLFFY